MKADIKNLYEALSHEIQNTYTSGITMEEAERLAARFLHAQMLVASDLQSSDLDARMKKSGCKAIKAAVYMEAAIKTDKKPSDSFLQNTVDMHEIVQREQQSLDEAESEKDSLYNYFSIFKEAHIYYRGIAKGRFE